MIFSKYETKFDVVRSQRAAQTTTSGKKKTTWGKIFVEDGASAGARLGAGIGAGAGLGTDLGAGISASSSLSRRTSTSALFQAATSGASLAGVSELSSYLNSGTINH